MGRLDTQEVNGLGNALSGNVCRRKALFTQPGDVFGWRTPEEVAVISAELRSA